MTRITIPCHLIPIVAPCVTAKAGTISRMMVKHTKTAAARRRLMDMGITPGVEIEIVKVAPLGDPIEINLRGYELSLRKSEAEQIKIEQL